jgi:hypothetical protein
LDKFGIFKLLSSFYDFYQKNKSNEKKEENQNTSSLAPFNLGFLSPKPKVENQAVETPKSNNRSLYLSMVNTISSHDKIVKRVTDKANKENTHPLS